MHKETFQSPNFTLGLILSIFFLSATIDLVWVLLTYWCDVLKILGFNHFNKFQPPKKKHKSSAWFKYAWINYRVVNTHTHTHTARAHSAVRMQSCSALLLCKKKIFEFALLEQNNTWHYVHTWTLPAYAFSFVMLTCANPRISGTFFFFCNCISVYAHVCLLTEVVIYKRKKIRF